VTNFFPNREDASDPLLDRLRASTVGLYDVAGEIGRGGMAVVYIATDLRLGRRVAIKVMEPRLNFTPGMAERFLQEARIAAQLQHHNIIVVHEVRHDEELIFFVMRLVEGGSLDEICRRLAQKQRQIPIDQAQWILWQSARALAYAHSEGIIHRDVKPANILISTKGEVVVTDFGIAKAVDAEGLTKSGMAIGTPTYMSPEQFVGQDPLSGAADQYALGIAAYEMLTGAPPFTGDLYRIIAAHGSTPAPDVREKRPDCPAPLAEAVMRMLAKKPEDRWPSLDAALPVLGQGLAIDGSTTRADLATVAVELQTARAASVTAWSALTPVTPSWSAGGTRRSKSVTRPVPAAITVSPPNAQTGTGKQLHLRAVVTSDTGTTIGDAVVTWTSSDPAVATVAPDGTVTGVSRGSAAIGAEVVVRDGSTNVVRAVAELRVTECEVTRVHIREGDQTVEAGEACRLTAELFDEDGSVVETANVNWASSDPDVVHVDGHGTVLALAGGQAAVSARVGGVQGSVRVEVRAAVMAAAAAELDLGSDTKLNSPKTPLPTDPGLGSGSQQSSPQSSVPIELSVGSVTKWSSPETPLPTEPSLGSVSQQSSPQSSVAFERSLGSDTKPSSPQAAASVPAPKSSPRPAAVLGSDPKFNATPSAPWWSNPRAVVAMAVAAVVVVSAVLLTTRDSRAKTAALNGATGTSVPTVVRGAKDSASLAPSSGIPSSSRPGASGAGNQGTIAANNRPSANGSDRQVPPKGTTPPSPNLSTPGPPAPTPQGAPSPSVPAKGRGQAVAPSGTITAVAPPPVARADFGIDPPATPTRAAEVGAPSENEMRRLSRDYVLRLERGEFRTGTLASFFSGATSSHRAAMVGQARVVRREGDALLVDVDLELERTMGSGAVQRRATSVRLVLRGRPSAAVIESATPGPLTNAR